MDLGVITTAITTLLGGGVVAAVTAFGTLKSARRKAEAEADVERWHFYKEQLDRMNEQIIFKDKRIEDLNAECASKTERIRKTQDELLESQKEAIALTAEAGALKLELAEHRCVKLHCPFREPETDKSRRAKAMLGIEDASGIPECEGVTLSRLTQLHYEEKEAND